MCLPNGFVKICLASTHDKCKQTNRHTLIGAEQTSFDIRSIYQHLRERYQTRMNAFAIAHSLLLYRPHISILGKQMCLFAFRSGVCLLYVYAALAEQLDHSPGVDDKPISFLKLHNFVLSYMPMWSVSSFCQ